MNAIRFIKEHGVEKAREVLRGSPALECYFVPKYQQYFVDKHGFVYVLGMFGYFTPSLGMTIENLTEHGFQISEMKRLLASVALVESKGGIANAQEDELRANELGFSYKDLKQAIADYEAIYLNDIKIEVSFGVSLMPAERLACIDLTPRPVIDCEILDFPEDYTSPNCKKFDERVK